ncbi:MAG TPA: hypothetical protein VIK08_03200 [Candidatus Limnocylindrales bacterium]
MHVAVAQRRAVLERVDPLKRGSCPLRAEKAGRSPDRVTVSILRCGQTSGRGVVHARVQRRELFREVIAAPRPRGQLVEHHPAVDSFVHESRPAVEGDRSEEVRRREPGEVDDPRDLRLFLDHLFGKAGPQQFQDASVVVGEDFCGATDPDALQRGQLRPL